MNRLLMTSRERRRYMLQVLWFEACRLGLYITAAVALSYCAALAGAREPHAMAALVMIIVHLTGGKR